MAEFQTGCPHCNAVLTVQEDGTWAAEALPAGE